VSSVLGDHFYADHAVVAVVVVVVDDDNTVHADAIVAAAEVGNIEAVVAVATATAAAVILDAASDVGNVKAVIAAEIPSESLVGTNSSGRSPPNSSPKSERSSGHSVSDQSLSVCVLGHSSVPFSLKISSNV
jgi:hypothetical protein